jgi:hypothetical protein
MVPAILEIEIEEVLEARMTSGLQTSEKEIKREG